MVLYCHPKLCFSNFHSGCLVLLFVGTTQHYPMFGSDTAAHCYFIRGGADGKEILSFFQDKMGLIIYVSLLLLTPEILSLPFDPQDNAFLSWAHSYAAFYNRSNCWVCGPLPSSSVKGVPWWTSPLQGKDFLQVCKYLQQSHVMLLLKLMTSNNLKMD